MGDELRWCFEGMLQLERDENGEEFRLTVCREVMLRLARANGSDMDIISGVVISRFGT